MCVFVCDGVCDVVWFVFLCACFVWLIVRVSGLCALLRDVVCAAAVSVLCVCLSLFVRAV